MPKCANCSGLMRKVAEVTMFQVVEEAHYDCHKCPSSTAIVRTPEASMANRMRVTGTVYTKETAATCPNYPGRGGEHCYWSPAVEAAKQQQKSLRICYLCPLAAKEPKAVKPKRENPIAKKQGAKER